MLFEIDDYMNISIARGYGVTFPVGIRNADASEYNMLPTDTLTFTVRNSVNSQTNIFQVTSHEKSITIPSSATANVNYGAYKYDITLTHAKEINFHETEVEQGVFYDAPVVSPSAGTLRDASINVVGGKTLVWNQTFDISMLRGNTTSYGVTSERTDNGIRLHGAFTSAINLPVINSWYDAIIGHKYLIANTPVSEALMLRVTQNGTYVNWQENTPFTATDTHTYLAIRVPSSQMIGVNFDVTWTPQIFDLTLMFGSGNEPATYEEFQQMFPASYYPYSQGTLLSAGVTEVVSKKADTTTIATYPIPAEIRNLEGYGWSAGTAYNYIDYERKVFVKNVARVDLGTLTWGSSSSSGKKYFFSSTLSSDIKYIAGSNGAVNNIIYPYGSTGTFLNAYNGAFDCISVGGAGVNVGRIGIYDSTKEEMTNAEFKASVSGVYAYYELATPVEIDISEYLTDDNLIEVESGGTLTFENQNGDDYRIPVPAMLTFNAYWSRTEAWVETIVTPKNFVIGGDDNALIDTYRKLLTSEYRHSPKLTNWLLWLLNEGTTYTTFIQMFVNAFDLDVAIGQQLDTIGRLVGVKRLLDFVPSGGESPLLDDETYRFLIKATIIKNTWKGKLEDLYSAWRVLYPESKLFQIQDLQDMTFNVIIAGDFTSLQKELISKGYIIPKPEGVRINLMTITDTSGFPLFSYDLDTLYYSGYNSHWTVPTP